MNMPKFRFSYLLIILFIGIALGDLRIYDPFVSEMQSRAEAKRMENPAYAKDRALEVEQREMESRAAELSTGEQLDLMIAALREKRDMTRTAAPAFGGLANAPLVNYVYKDWSYDRKIGDERLVMLLEKIERDGRPSIGQLKRYQLVARNCAYQESVRSLEDAKSTQACMDYARMINGQSHGGVSPLFATETY